jgi:hypothetical protein
MSLPTEPVEVVAKNDLVREDIMHFEGGNAEAHSLKNGVGYEYVEFANSRKKVLWNASSSGKWICLLCLFWL